MTVEHCSHNHNHQYFHTRTKLSIGSVCWPATTLLYIIDLQKTTMPENKVAKIAEPFVCGGTAATLASIAIHPMDLAKVRACVMMVW
jgi:hypothetical protein